MDKKKPENVCALCNGEGQLRCSACQDVFYCSKEHQKQHWAQHKTLCRPFDIKSSKELGRYLECKRELCAGSTVISEKPLVFGPKTLVGIEPQCLGCYQPNPSEKCPRCQWPICGLTCIGLVDPNHHVPECIVLSLSDVAQSQNFLFEAITPLRCLLLQKRNPKKWKQILSLESHIKKRGPGTEEYKATERIAQYLQENIFSKLESDALPDMSSSIIHAICGIIEVNGIEITTGKGEICALYPMACLMEHSCIPNTKYNFSLDDFKIEVTASTDIKKSDHICTMYTHMLWGTQARREHLLSTKYFLCKCRRCLDPIELGTNFSSIKCLGVVPDDVSTPCPGYMLPTNLKDVHSDWKCSLCPAVLTSAHVTNFISRINADVDEAIEEPTIKKLVGLISKLEKLLHQNHYACFMVKHSLIQLYGREPGHEIEKLSEVDLSKKLELCNALLNLVMTLDPGQCRVSLYTGVILLELHSGLFELQKRSKEPTDKAKYLSEAKKHLEMCVRFLQSEPVFTAGSSMYSIAKSHLVVVNSELKKYKIIEL